MKSSAPKIDPAFAVALEAVRAARAALAAAEALLEAGPVAAPAQAAPSPFVDLLAELGGTRRAAREWASRRGLATTRAGAKLLVDRAAYEAALAAHASRRTVKATSPAPVVDDDDAEILARAGLRLVTPRRAAGGRS